MDLNAYKRYRGQKDPDCGVCKGSGVMLQCFASGPPMEVQCRHCFERNYCSTCGGECAVPHSRPGRDD